MKQRITVGQLNKLSDEQKERLREWWKPEEGDFFKHDFSDEVRIYLVIPAGYDNVGDEPEHGSLPLLSIGQMIQFIQEKKPQLKSIAKNRFDKWFINIDTATLGYKDELCDALWEATIQVLKNSE